jgi:ZIP family zinc transporter
MGTILDLFERIDPVMGAFIATTFTWLVTASGSALVFVVGNASRKWLDGMLGFTAE